MDKSDIELHEKRKLQIMMQHVNDDENAVWHTRRLLGIGGSEVSAVLGLDSFGKTPFDVWMNKTGRKTDRFSNRFTKWGTILEDTVARHFADLTGFSVARSNKHYSLESAPWLVGNVDRLVTINGSRSAVLECKTASAYSDSKFNKSAAWYSDEQFHDENMIGIQSETDVPLNYYFQCQHYMLVTGIHKCFLAALIGGNDFRIFVIPFNETVAKLIYSKCSEFWCQNVLKDVAPQPTSNDFIKSYFEEKSVIIANQDVSMLIAKYKDLKKSIDNLENEQDEIKKKIIEFIGVNDELLDADGNKVATFRASSRSSLNIDAMSETERKTYEQLVAKYTIKKLDENRTLRFSSAKKKGNK